MWKISEYWLCDDGTKHQQKTRHYASQGRYRRGLRTAEEKCERFPGHFFFEAFCCEEPQWQQILSTDP